jgi:hypothetical protein
MSIASNSNDANLKAAREINREARSDPTSRYAGKYVGIARGKVVVVDDCLDDVVRQLQQIEPDPTQRLFLEAGADYDGPHEIWKT